jgi:pilus assembly protein CpaE
MQVDATSIAKTLQTFASFPVGATDPVIRRIRDANANVIMVDVPRHNSGDALHAIDLIRTEVPGAAIFAIGEVSQPQVIINSMRAGAREFLERPTNTNSLLDAFVRMTSSERKTQTQGQRGKVFTFINAKGGCGATTLAVNTALHLQSTGGGTALVDLAPLGHAALHLNVTPAYTVADALHNVYRLDQSLMESFMTPCPSGVQLLAGVSQPLTDAALTSELARMVDVLVSRFRYVVVDASSRLDAPVRLVCDLSDTVMVVAQTDVASLWSAAKVQEYLSQTGGNSRLRLVINRFRKIPGFKESDIESATRMKVMQCVPNHYVAVAAAIERGFPVAQQNHSEISRAMGDLAGILTNQTDLNVAANTKKRKQFSIF